MMPARRKKLKGNSEQMKIVITLIDIVCLTPFLFFASYLAFLTFLAMLRKLRQIEQDASHTNRRFAVLVPAHDEETVIEQTLRSLKQMDYPESSFEIVVIADNCTDKTADISRALGVTVLERFDNVNKGKGFALRWCLDKIIHSVPRYDAFVVIDADSVVSRNFLTVMSAYLEDGADCIQSSDMVIPQPGSWSPEMTRVAFILHNYVRPLGKLSIGCSSGLNGNGMCFSRKLIETMPWNAYSRVEDLEHSLQLALDNVRIHFAPEAAVRAIMPSDPKNAETQRRRWEMGRFPLIMKYTKPLILGSIRKRSFMIFDMFIELITPAFLNIFGFTSIMLALNLFALLVGAPWLTSITILWTLALLLETFHVLGGLKAAQADGDTYLVLMKLPKYAAWKLSLYFKTWLRGDEKQWVRTARDTTDPKQ